jgi:predicted phage tail protein
MSKGNGTTKRTLASIYDQGLGDGRAITPAEAYEAGKRAGSSAVKGALLLAATKQSTMADARAALRASAMGMVNAPVGGPESPVVEDSPELSLS